MFRISFLVDDRNLVKILRTITPVAVGLNVSSAAPNGSGAPVTTLRRTQSLDLLMRTLSRHNLKTFKMTKFREITKEAGLNPVSANYYMRELIKHGSLSMLGRKGKNVTYQVIQ